MLSNIVYSYFLYAFSKHTIGSAFNGFALSCYTYHRCNLYFWRYLHGDVIKSHSHVPGYTGNPNRSLLSRDSINSSLTNLFIEFYLAESTIFYILYLILKLNMSTLYTFTKKILDFKFIKDHTCLHQLRIKIFMSNHYILFNDFYCPSLLLVYNFSHLERNHYCYSQRYPSKVASLFSIVIPRFAVTRLPVRFLRVQVHSIYIVLFIHVIYAIETIRSVVSRGREYRTIS